MQLLRAWMNWQRTALLAAGLLAIFSRDDATFEEPWLVVIIFFGGCVALLWAGVLELLRSVARFMQRPQDVAMVARWNTRFFLPCLFGTVVVLVAVTIDRRWGASSFDVSNQIEVRRVACNTATGYGLARNSHNVARNSRNVPEYRGMYCFAQQLPDGSAINTLASRVAGLMGREIEGGYAIIQIPKSMAPNIPMERAATLAFTQRPSLFGVGSYRTAQAVDGQSSDTDTR